MSAFGTDTGLFAPDPKQPVDGSALNAQYLRSALGNIQTHLRNTTYFGAEPSVPAQVISDVYNYPLNLTTNYNLDITINGNNQVVNCQGSTPSATTLNEIVQKINTAYAAVGTVAYNVGGFLLVRSRFGGAASSITIDQADSNDASELIFSLASRGVSYPVTYTGSDLPEGTFWGVGADIQNINYRSVRNATILGRKNLSSAVDLTVARFLNLTIKGQTVSIDLTSETQSVTSAVPRDDIVEAINVALQDQFSDSFTYASLLGEKIKITTNDSNPIILNFAVNGNAAPVVLGYPEDRSFYPKSFNYQTSNTAFIRGANVGGGIGIWGLPAETVAELTDPVIDQEIRFVRDKGIFYSYNTTTGTWSPTIAKTKTPFARSDDGTLKLFDTKGSQNSDNRIISSYPESLDNPLNLRPSDRIGYIPTLIPAAHPSIPNVTYSGVNHFRANTHYDKFTRANTPAGTVGATPTGLTWTSTKSKSKILNNRLAYLDSDYTDPDIVTLPIITNGGAAINNFTVAGKFFKNKSSNGGNEAQVGFCFYLNSATAPTSGYVVMVTDKGVIKLHRITTGGALVTPPVAFANIDKPLGVDSGGITPDLGFLKVKKAFGAPIFEVSWRNSADAADWETEDSRGEGVYILSDGTPNPPAETNRVGVWLNPGGDASIAKDVYLEDFYYQPAITEYPALPPVSGQRLKDIITSVRISGQTSIINDAGPHTPLVINNGPGILLSQNTVGRIITISADTNFLMSRAQHTLTDHTSVIDIRTQVVTAFPQSPGGQGYGGPFNVGYEFVGVEYNTSAFRYTVTASLMGVKFNGSTGGGDQVTITGTAATGSGVGNANTAVSCTVQASSSVGVSAILFTLYKTRNVTG